MRCRFSAKLWYNTDMKIDMKRGDIFIPQTGSFAGHLLIATPAVQDSCFTRSVIYMCAHNDAGAMGIIINYPVRNLRMKEIFSHLDIPAKDNLHELPIHFGGPVEANRGFVLHSADYDTKESLVNQGGIVVTSSLSILEDLAEGKGPAQGMLVLGYAGWSPGQLESEIESGSWITIPASPQLVFDTHNDVKWNTAVSSLGIDIGHFSATVGHA